MTLYMVLFQCSLVILCSTHSSLSKCGCNWFAMGIETNSSLDTVTEQTIFKFLVIFSPIPQNVLCCEIFNISLKEAFSQNHMTLS